MQKLCFMLALLCCTTVFTAEAQYSVELNVGPAIAGANLDNYYGTTFTYGIKANYRAKDSELEWSVGINKLNFSGIISVGNYDIESNENYTPILIGLKRYLSDDSKISPYINLELGVCDWKSDAKALGVYAEQSGRTLMYIFGFGGSMIITPTLSASLGAHYNSLGVKDALIYYTVLGGIKFKL